MLKSTHFLFPLATSSPHKSSPDVVAAAQNHASFAVAGGANVAQLGLAAGALEAASVPITLHGEEQETVSDLPPTSCT